MDPTWVFNFFTFFERILYKSNCIIFIFSWCATHTKIRSKLVVIVTAESQKITLWGPQRTPHGILRVKRHHIWCDSRLCLRDVDTLQQCGDNGTAGFGQAAVQPSVVTRWTHVTRHQDACHGQHAWLEPQPTIGPSSGFLQTTVSRPHS